MSSSTQPIELHDFIIAIKDLSDENLHSIHAQLENSIRKLKESNELLQHEIATAKDLIGKLAPEQSHHELKEDLLLYTETVKENELVIERQSERITELNLELATRGVPQAGAHPKAPKAQTAPEPSAPENASASLEQPPLVRNSDTAVSQQDEIYL